MKLFTHLQLIILIIMSAFTAQVLSEPSGDSIEFSVITTAESSGSLEAMVVDGGSWFTIRKLVHTAVLVRHPKGDFLWDSGIGAEYKDQMSVLNSWEKQLFSIDNVRTAREQLASEGYAVDELMAIIPSHMHWDHASGLEDFAGIPIWLPKESHQEAIHGEPPAFIKSQYDASNLLWEYIQLASTSYMGFSQSLDIYGDGTAVLVDLTGHTHGQLGLFLNLPTGERYFFIGDTAWSVIGVERNKSRPAFVDYLVGVDTDYEKNAAVINKIYELTKANPGVVIVPAHDELQVAKLPNYPVFSQ